MTYFYFNQQGGRTLHTELLPIQHEASPTHTNTIGEKAAAACSNSVIIIISSRGVETGRKRESKRSGGGKIPTTIKQTTRRPSC